jgi:hypothetical protein
MESHHPELYLNYSKDWGSQMVSIDRCWTVVAGGAVVVLLSVAASSCSNDGEQTPDTTTTTITTTSAGSTQSPTEKSVNPTGGNLFTPPVRATPAPNYTPNPTWWVPR